MGCGGGNSGSSMCSGGQPDLPPQVAQAANAPVAQPVAPQNDNSVSSVAPVANTPSPLATAPVPTAPVTATNPMPITGTLPQGGA